MNRLSGRRADVILALVLFLIAAVIGSARYGRAMQRGPHPFFYQSYFEPAVMLACGRGFGVAESPARVPSLQAFLIEQADRFSCRDIPRDLVVGSAGRYQDPWRYLMTAVAVSWMVLGISWSGLGPLFGVLFGATTALVFILCRLVVRRSLAVACAGLLCVSPLQLANLPNLRDYAKAPFTLALIAILVALAVRPLRPRAILLASLAYGLILGVGYGFRTDLLIDIPPFIVVALLFLPGGVLNNLPLKAAAVGLLVGGFFIAAWPIIRSVTSGGGCQWHFPLLGLSDPFNTALGVRGGSYGWGHLYKDEYVWATVSAFAGRVRPDAGYIEYCSPQYDAASWEYLKNIAITFPADLLTRAYAAIIHVLELPFERLGPLRIIGPLGAAGCVAILSAVNLRLALFALFVVAYFGGHPAIQFLPRHFFVFEFLGWLSFAMLAQQTIPVLRRDFDNRAIVPAKPRIRRAAACLLLVVVAFSLPLFVLRAYQQRQVLELLARYEAAPASELNAVRGDDGAFQLAREHHGPPPTKIEVINAMAALGHPAARFMRVTVDPAGCRPQTTMTFRYDPAFPQLDFSHTIPLPESNGPILTFEPVYDGFTGIVMSDPSPSCLPRASVTRADGLALWLPSQLLPAWRSQPQYQTLAFSR